jgi:hypothetical protein
MINLYKKRLRETRLNPARLKGTWAEAIPCETKLTGSRGIGGNFLTRHPYDKKW